MTNKYGPWIAFNPGDTPPADGVMVQPRFSDDTGDAVSARDPDFVSAWYWEIDGDDYDIIAYRILQQPVQGKVVKYVDDVTLFSEQHFRHDTHRVTFPTDDGLLIPGTYTGPDGATIKIEVTK